MQKELINYNNSNSNHEAESLHLMNKKIDFWRQITGKLLSEVKSLAFLTTVPLEKISEGIDLDEEVKNLEIRLIEHALELTCGNQKLAAQLLNLKKTTLNAKIKRYCINSRKTVFFSKIV